MTAVLEDLRVHFETPERRKFIRYTLASVISVVITTVLTTIGYGIVRLSGDQAAFAASTIAAVPSYYMNRSWVWKKTGRSHLRKEVIPFWVMAIVGLIISTWVSGETDTIIRQYTDSHGLRTLVVTSASIAVFGVLWIFKYVVFNRLMFVHREEDLDPALDGRSGWPT